MSYLFGVAFLDGDLVAGLQTEVYGAGGGGYVEGGAVLFSQHG